MIALVDCNSFFCSVEKVFHPGLSGRPVCVLSSNDGCVVALTPEAKALGLHRGDPLFKVKDIVEANNVVIFSSNMQLYSVMSRRVTNILRRNIAHVENYSIDESFCYLDGYERVYNLEDMMRSLADKIKLYTDIPVSVGIAPTKTLAKVGSKFAKKYKGYHGVCMIDTEDRRRKALSMFPLKDVWGIGRRMLDKLYYYGITETLQFADMKESWVKARFSQPICQTWTELNGTPCIDTAEVMRNKSISTSRSFGDMVGDLESLKSSTAVFAASCANKLRVQHAVASEVTVFIKSNRFRNDLGQYANVATCYLETPTADTIEITDAALRLLKDIYRPGIMYKKVGVVLGNITDDYAIQQQLFDGITNRKERAALMNTIDSLNHRYGLKTVRLMAEGERKQHWNVKSEYKSKNYLTDINEILTIKI